MCVRVMHAILSSPPASCSGEVSFQISSPPPPPLCRKNLELNITFYHPQSKPDKPRPCLCASLLAAIITLRGSDIKLAHSSGHAAPFVMCPHSTQPLYQQWGWGGVGGKAPVEQMLNSEQCPRCVCLFRSPC